MVIAKKNNSLWWNVNVEAAKTKWIEMVSKITLPFCPLCIHWDVSVRQMVWAGSSYREPFFKKYFLHLKNTRTLTTSEEKQYCIAPPYSMPEILKGRSAKNFSILVTVNSSWQLLNQISKRNCKILLVPTKIFKNFWNSLGSLWPKNWSYKR